MKSHNGLSSEQPFSNRDKPKLLAADTVIICAGQESENELVKDLEKYGIKFYVIGGALKAGEVDAKRAIMEGVELGLKI